MRIPPLALLASLVLCLGCAHQAATGVPLASRGPGHVFPTVEEAAVDALIHAHLESRSDGLHRRVRGGTIEALEDGRFTYRQLQVASRHEPHALRLELGPRDVAHFRAYTRDLQTAVNRVRERPSLSLRRLVDERDPLHRPAFMLTPSLRVRVYRGRDEGVFEVADLKALSGENVIARSH